MPRVKLTNAEREAKVEANRLIKDAPKRKKKKSKVTSPLKPEKVETRKYYCFSCGKDYDKLAGNFSVSPHPFFKGNDGYIPVCRDCMEHYEQEYEELLDGDSDAAIRRLAMYFGYYASDSIISASKRANSSQSRMFSLASKSGMTQYVGKTYDTYLDELRRSEGVESIDDLKESGETRVTNKMLKFWGTGYAPDDYIYLNDKYGEWTSRHECKTKAQESIFQKICLMELQIKKAIQKGDKVDSLIKAFDGMLGSANIKPVQTKDNALADQNAFGVLIHKLENTRPVPEPSPEFQDVDGIMKLISTWFLGHMCKMLKINNKYSKFFEDEIAEYTANKPEYQYDLDPFEDIFTSNLKDRGADDGE